MGESRTRNGLPGLLPLLFLTASLTVSLTARAQDESGDQGQDEAMDWVQLAASWAPLINQSTRNAFKSDVLASFDFDGDWDAANNQTSRGGMPSRVYYWVIETAGHYYIGYAFYHILDEPGFKTEEAKAYAHDMQGIVVAVEKSEENPNGRFLALASWGDGREAFYVEREAYEGEYSEAWQQSVSFSEKPPESSRDIDFTFDSAGFHPVVYAEAGHHAVFGEKAETAFPEGPDLYELNGVTYLPLARTNRRSNRARGGRGHKPGSTSVSATAEGVIPKDDGLIYRHEGYPQEVITARTTGRGTVLHHWNLISYDLQSLGEFWDRRTDPGDDAAERVFGTPGVFATGEKLQAGPSSRAPWAWGAVFFDPAAYFAGLTGADAGQTAITATSFAAVDELAAEHAAYKEASP